MFGGVNETWGGGGFLRRGADLRHLTAFRGARGKLHPLCVRDGRRWAGVGRAVLEGGFCADH